MAEGDPTIEACSICGNEVSSENLADVLGKRVCPGCQVKVGDYLEALTLVQMTPASG